MRPDRSVLSRRQSHIVAACQRLELLFFHQVSHIAACANRLQTKAGERENSGYPNFTALLSPKVPERLLSYGVKPAGCT